MVPQILRPRLVTGKWGIRLLLLVGPAAIRLVQWMSRSTAGGVNYPIEMQIYSGSDPNTGHSSDGIARQLWRKHYSV